MKQNLKQHTVLAALLGLVIFLAPTNFFYILDRSGAYTSGLFSDYLLLRMFASDLALGILAVTVILLEKKRIINALQSFARKPLQHPAVLTWLALGTLQLLQPLPFVGSMHWLRWSIWAVVLVLLWRQRKQLVRSVIVQYSIVCTILFQATVGLWQYATQSELGGYLLLGEPTLSSIGIAKSGVLSVVQVLPYGTTAHPNILAGVLAVYSLLLWKVRTQLPRSIVLTAVSLGCFTILLTESVSAYLALGVAVGAAVLSKILPQKTAQYARIATITILLTPLILFAVLPAAADQPSLFRRNYLQETALVLLIDNPVFGTGLGQFTAQIERQSFTHETVAFLQPVHHGVLLWLAETGILGAVSLFLVLKRAEKVDNFSPALSLLPLTPLLALDHYIASQPVGVAILGLVLLLETDAT